MPDSPCGEKWLNLIDHDFPFWYPVHSFLARLRIPFDMSFRCPIKTRWGRPYASPCAEVFQCKSLRPWPELSQGGFLGAKFYLRNSFIKELEQSINLAFYAPQGLNVIFNIKHLFLSLSPWVNCEQPVIGAGVCKNDQAVQKSLNILFELTVTPILAVSTTAFPGYQIYIVLCFPSSNVFFYVFFYVFFIILFFLIHVPIPSFHRTTNLQDPHQA